MEQDPQNITLVVQLSNLMLELKQYDESLKLLNKYLKDDETDPQLYWNLGRTYAALDNTEKAKEYYDLAYSYLNGQAEFLRDAAYFYRNNGQRDLALKCCNKFLKQDPNDEEMVQLHDELVY